VAWIASLKVGIARFGQQEKEGNNAQTLISPVFIHLRGQQAAWAWLALVALPWHWDRVPRGMSAANGPSPGYQHVFDSAWAINGSALWRHNENENTIFIW